MLILMLFAASGLGSTTSTLAQDEAITTPPGAEARPAPRVAAQSFSLGFGAYSYLGARGGSLTGPYAFAEQRWRSLAVSLGYGVGFGSTQSPRGGLGQVQQTFSGEVGAVARSGRAQVGVGAGWRHSYLAVSLDGDAIGNIWFGGPFTRARARWWITDTWSLGFSGELGLVAAQAEVFIDGESVVRQVGLWTTIQANASVVLF